MVERYLGQLANASGDESAERIIRELLASSVRRLHLLCVTLLRRNYPRLSRPPMNLEAGEMLSGVVERMMKALRKVRPSTVREFFALANQHMRWELNEFARRREEHAAELRESSVESPTEIGRESSRITPNTARMMDAIDALPLSGPGPGNDAGRRGGGAGSLSQNGAVPTGSNLAAAGWVAPRLQPQIPSEGDVGASRS